MKMKKKHARINIEYQIDQMDGLEIPKILGIYHYIWICFSLQQHLRIYIYSTCLVSRYYIFLFQLVGIAIYLPHNLSLIHPEENHSMHFVIIKTKSKLVLLYFFFIGGQYFLGVELKIYYGITLVLNH